MSMLLKIKILIKDKIRIFFWNIGHRSRSHFFRLTLIAAVYVQLAGNRIMINKAIIHL